MQHIISKSRAARWLIATLLSLACAAQADGYDTYDRSNDTAAIPVVVIGNATYTNVVIKVGTIYDGPSGTAPNGGVDTYNPLDQQITAPAVLVDGVLKYNYVAVVAGLISIGGVTGADTLNGDQLTIASVQVEDGTVYSNVVITVGPYIGNPGGMPLSQDQYDSNTNQLTVAAYTAGGTVYTNQVFSVGKVISVGSQTVAVPNQVLYSFRGGPAIYGNESTDGADPQANLILGSDGNYYGTTFYGGSNDMGTVFRITPAGVETVLYSFTGNDDHLALSPTNDAIWPESLIQGSDGNLYGTGGGGAFAQGAIFRVTLTGSETVLYSFSGGSGNSTDAWGPGGLIQGSDGNLYGTGGGGTYSEGAVFKVTTAGTETILHSFSGGPYGVPGSTDGADVLFVVLGTDGNFYGTTESGGIYNGGTLFRITPAGDESVINSFPSSFAGNYCIGPLVQGSDGNFYETTEFGGTYDEGMVVKITPGAGETVLHSFSGEGGLSGSTDGAFPYAGLIQASDGNLYGTTLIGGAYREGIVFKITLGGDESVVYSFTGLDGIVDSTDGAGPQAGLIEGSGGSLYGTTAVGGVLGFGTVFALTNVVPTNQDASRIGSLARRRIQESR